MRSRVNENGGGRRGGGRMSAVRERSRAFTFNLHRQKDRQAQGPVYLCSLDRYCFPYIGVRTELA